MTSLDGTFLAQPGSKGVYVYLSIILILFGIYALGLYLIYNGDAAENDPFCNVYVEDIPVFNNLGGWPVSHVVTFFVAGLLFPNQWVLIFMMGVLWEFIEEAMGTVIPSPGNPASEGEIKLYQKNWVAGDLSDIWYNSVGLFFGYWTARLISHRREQLHKVTPLSSDKTHCIKASEKLIDLGGPIGVI